MISKTPASCFWKKPNPPQEKQTRLDQLPQANTPLINIHTMKETISGALGKRALDQATPYWFSTADGS
jgi:hypothetical protein